MKPPARVFAKRIHTFELDWGISHESICDDSSAFVELVLKFFDVAARIAGYGDLAKVLLVWRYQSRPEVFEPFSARLGILQIPITGARRVFPKPSLKLVKVGVGL